MKYVPPPTIARRHRPGFSLPEMLAAITVLLLLALLIGQLFNSASSISLMGTKRMDSDAQARAVFDRMLVDFSHMLNRPDLDCYSKNPGLAQPGNDQIAFFSDVPGYYPSNARSPISLVAYRVDQNLLELQRMGKGLAWNGVSATAVPIVFLPLTIKDCWPAATDQQPDRDYDRIGPNVFRFEYIYLLKAQRLADGSSVPSILSNAPWDTRPEVRHTALNGMRDVEAIEFYFALIDPAARGRLAPGGLASLAGNLKDFREGALPAELPEQWQSAIENSGLPKSVTAAVRLYRRTISLGW